MTKSREAFVAAKDWVRMSLAGGLRVARRLPSAIMTLPDMARLAVRNLLSRSAIYEYGTVAVSLTSYGHRLRSVFFTIESIGRGDVKPQSITLWLDDPKLFENLPRSLRRLTKRGLVVKLVPGRFGPHTKFYHHVVAASGRGSFVTADDDVLYPQDWLGKLLSAHYENPKDIVCHRAHVVVVVDSSIAPYDQWGSCDHTAPRYGNFATGVSGVLYPPEMAEALLDRGAGFLSTCPNADDIWLHQTSINQSIKTRQVAASPTSYPVIPGSQSMALARSNTVQGGNDWQVSATYTDEDIRLLIAERDGAD